MIRAILSFICCLIAMAFGCVVNLIAAYAFAGVIAFTLMRWAFEPHGAEVAEVIIMAIFWPIMLAMAILFAAAASGAPY